MTTSLEDYLESIYILILSGKPARLRDISSSLGVKTPSAVNAVNQLLKLGYVTHRPYDPVELTQLGRSKALEILARHSLLTAFLRALGVSAEVAEADACRMEHILSPETYIAFDNFLKKHRLDTIPKAQLHSQIRNNARK